jgi:hypothetical protein
MLLDVGMTMPDPSQDDVHFIGGFDPPNNMPFARKLEVKTEAIMRDLAGVFFPGSHFPPNATSAEVIHAVCACGKCLALSGMMRSFELRDGHFELTIPVREILISRAEEGTWLFAWIALAEGVTERAIERGNLQLARQARFVYWER